MLYIYILGYELDFGHVEAYNLITGKLYTEKQIVSPCHLPSPLSSPHPPAHPKLFAFRVTLLPV